MSLSVLSQPHICFLFCLPKLEELLKLPVFSHAFPFDFSRHVSVEKTTFRPTDQFKHVSVNVS